MKVICRWIPFTSVANIGSASIFSFLVRISPLIRRGQLLEDIERDRFRLLPQPEFKVMFQQRVDDILTESNPPDLAETRVSNRQQSD